VRDGILYSGTALVVGGILLILWRELRGAAERRTVGPVRDVIEVLLPVVATIGLLVWVWAWID
jgi:hypothetical protein